MTHQRIDSVTRQRVLELLSDDEVAQVTCAESKALLPEGDEDLDLEQLHRGVRRALASTPAGRVLKRHAVRAETGRKIVALAHRDGAR